MVVGDNITVTGPDNAASRTLGGGCGHIYGHNRRRTGCRNPDNGIFVSGILGVHPLILVIAGNRCGRRRSAGGRILGGRGIENTFQRILAGFDAVIPFFQQSMQSSAGKQHQHKHQQSGNNGESNDQALLGVFTGGLRRSRRRIRRCGPVKAAVASERERTVRDSAVRSSLVPDFIPDPVSRNPVSRNSAVRNPVSLILAFRIFTGVFFQMSILCFKGVLRAFNVFGVSGSVPGCGLRTL